MRNLALALAASWLAAALAAAFPGVPPHHFEPPSPEQVIAKHAAELGIAEETLAQIRTLGEQHRSERSVIVAELRQQKLALRTLLEGAQPSEAEAIALARKIGTLETDLSVSRLAAMMRMHALLTPEQNAALREKLRGRYAERRALLESATAACQKEIAEYCEPADGPPGAALMCLLHQRRSQGFAVSSACEAALREIPPPHFRRHHGPPPDVLVPPPGEAD